MKKSAISLIVLALSLFLFSCNKTGTEEKYMNESAEVRIQNVLAKIRRGESVTVVTLGGSITTGYSSNPINQNSWAAKTQEWFSKLAKESGARLNFLNEGVSGTDSAFAVARVKDHVINNKADLVILEFSVNDLWLDPSTRNKTYEGVIRQIMNNSNTAILALFINILGDGSGVLLPSQQKDQQPICDYYHIPYVSWKDCVLAEGSEKDFEKFYDGNETVHPNNAGHASIASYIIQKLQGYWDNLPEDKEIPSPVKVLPAAKESDKFEFVEYYHKDNLSPSSNKGWEIGGTPEHDDWIKRGNVRQGWKTKEVNGEITFEVEGSIIGVTYCESDQYRNAVAWVTGPDGKDSEKVTLQCYSSIRNGYYGWAYKELVSGDDVKKYTVHVKCSKRGGSDKEGKYCNITGIIATKK